MIDEQMNIVIVGHVDHGKSTVIGRLLADTGSLPDGKLEQIKRNCELNSKPFEYAFLLDALKDEQAQGITIDAARVFFQTQKRHYIIIDAPGHIEFLKNMITGASRAEAALLVIDAQEGIKENSRRHGYMLSMLGIKQVVVLINKMDLVDYNQEIYEDIVRNYKAFLNEINLEVEYFIPVSGMKGDNIASNKSNMSWYKQNSVLDVLDTFKKESAPAEKPFRMPVQDVYKFTKFDDNRRIISGTIDTGTIKIGDEVVFYPSGKKSRIKTIEGFNIPTQSEAIAGYATGFTLDEQIYLTRGEVAVKSNEPKPSVTSRIMVSIFWLGRKPLIPNKNYLLKIGTSKVAVKLEKIIRVIDASDLDAKLEKNQIERHDVAECILKLNKAIAFDTSDKISNLSRFVIVDDYEICGGGIIREGKEDKQSWMREGVFLRNSKWIQSDIHPSQRAVKFNQRSTLILITGEKGSGRKAVAKSLEKQLFNEGKIIYYLGLGNVLYGVDADIRDKEINNRQEHFRRLGEVAHILLDSGMLLVVTARELTQDDLEVLKTSVNPDIIEVIWTGENLTTDISVDLHLTQSRDTNSSVMQIKNLLQDKGIIFRPW